MNYVRFYFCCFCKSKNLYQLSACIVSNNNCKWFNVLSSAAFIFIVPYRATVLHILEQKQLFAFVKVKYIILRLYLLENKKIKH